MNINVSSVELKSAIEKVERLLTKTLTTLPIINSVMIKAENKEVTITAYNLESFLTVEIYGEIIDPGSILIDKSNFKLIKKLSGIVNITSNDNLGMVEVDGKEKEEIVSSTITIKANRNVKFNSIPSEQFPELPEDINEEAFTIIENVFRDKLKIKAFTAKNHFRHVFNSVLIYNDDIVATDTHSLARYKLNIKNKCEGQIIIPVKSINELDKILNNKSTSELQFSYSKKDDGELNCLKIKGKGYTYTTRLESGVFPNYNQVIPESFCTFIDIEKDKLQDSLDFAKEVVKDVKLTPVIFTITDEKLNFHTRKGEEKSMSEILPADITGDELNICFNNEYLGIILKTISEDNIDIRLSGRKSPALFKGKDNQDELYVLVPIRMENDSDYEVAV